MLTEQRGRKSRETVEPDFLFISNEAWNITLGLTFRMLFATPFTRRVGASLYEKRSQYKYQLAEMFYLAAKASHPDTIPPLLRGFRAWEFIIQLQKPIKQMRLPVTGSVSYTAFSEQHDQRENFEWIVLHFRIGCQTETPWRCYYLYVLLSTQWELFNQSFGGTQSALQNYTNLSWMFVHCTNKRVGASWLKLLIVIPRTKWPTSSMVYFVE